MRYRELLNELSEEILNLKKMVRELKDKLSFSGKLEKTEKGLYVNEKNGKRVGPYCTHCFEAEDKHISLKETTNPKKRNVCPRCKNYYD